LANLLKTSRDFMHQCINVYASQHTVWTAEKCWTAHCHLDQLQTLAWKTFSTGMF